MNNSKKILITGATGLLGSNVARVFSGRGYSLKVLVRKSSNLKALEGVEAELCYGDVTDKESILNALSGCEYAVHSAALVSMWAGHLKQMEDVNVGGTKNFLEACKAYGRLEKIVHVSTVDAIGMQSKENPSDETVAWDYSQYKNGYALTKKKAQDIALKFAGEGLPVVIVNPTYMFGAHDTKPSSGQMIIEVVKGRARFYTTGGNNLVDVLDVATGIANALDRGRIGELHILGNDSYNLTYKEIFGLIADVTKSPKPIAPIPKPLALIAGSALDKISVLLNKPTSLSYASAFMGYQLHYFTSKKAQADLGLPQSPVEGAIERAYKWFKQNGYL